jgi:N6-L-threonylcarbamoyladenine synthase
MKILSIDTSCDETAAAVTEGTNILSNIIWSQASLHAKFGGVMPSLAQRMHEERIDWVIDHAIKNSKLKIENLDCIAVTIGPGLSIALGVGIDRAKKLALKHNKKLIAVNHLEAHILSPLANFKFKILNSKFPMLGLVVSGGNTLLVKINKIGEYEILAQTTDDALGEALDKGARMLGLGYPGGAILEKMSRLASSGQALYKLPIPIIGQEKRMIFTYSGLKTAMSRLVESEKPLSKDKIYNLAASFQDVAFTHLIRVISYVLNHSTNQPFSHFLIGGGVCANIELRKRLRKLGKEYGINILFPYSKRLTGDNAAMIGIAASFKAIRGEFINPDIIDRIPNLKINT